MARVPRSGTARAAVLVVTIVVVVAFTTAGAYVPIDGDGRAEPNHSEYAPSKLVPERADSTGDVSVEPADRSGLVVIDATHLNRYESQQLQPLVSAITDAGYRVEFSDSFLNFEASLSRADALVIIDPGIEYTAGDVAAVEEFVADGGRLVMVGEPTQADVVGGGFFASISTVRNKMTPLATEFGIDFGEGYLFDMSRNDGNFQNVFADGTDSNLAVGVDRAALFTATSVSSRSGTPILVARGTRNSRTDDVGDYPVAIRDGNVLGIGDKTFLFRGNYQVGDNERLIGNVVSFLTSAERERDLNDYPAVVEDDDPVIRYTSPAMLEGAQELATSLRGVGRQPTFLLTRGGTRAQDTDVLVTTYDYLQEHDVEGVDIEVTNGQVSVPGYASPTTGVIVVQVPASGIDLIVVADTPERAVEGATTLVDEDIEQFAVGSRTAVIRTADATVPTPTATPSPEPTNTTETGEAGG